MKVLNWVIALVGMWEFGDIAAVFVPGFGSIHAFVWSHIIAGIILMIAGVGAALTRDADAVKTMNWTAAAAGAWLMIAPFVLGAPVIAAGLWNDIIVGAIILILSILAALSARRVQGQS
jgi:hypothetical protein